MTNKKIWLGMLALALAFGMAVVGCGDGNGDEGGGEKEINLPSTSGEFTLTDIPVKYNDKFALLEGYLPADSRVIVGYKGATINTSDPGHFSTMSCAKIENGTVKLPLYTYSSGSSSPVSTIQAYTGNDSAFVDILIFDNEIFRAGSQYIAVAYFGTYSGTTPTSFPFQFTSGKATKSNNDATSKLN
jgi:hypothetical protein